MAQATIPSMGAARIKSLLIVGNVEGIFHEPSEVGKLRQFVSQGGRVLMLHPGVILAKLFPDQVKSFTAKKGEIATIHVPESAVFSGIKPLDLAWFERGEGQLPIACTGVYQIAAAREDTMALACQCDFHGSLQNPTDVEKISGAPLAEIRLGNMLRVQELNGASNLCVG
ncbi:MAG: hypothetical protein ACREE6_10510 [Limisphaerales bacterium]